MLCLIMLGVLETGRLVLVYTTIANAARAGARYAIVHGSSRATGTLITNASGPSANPAQILTVIKNFASAGALTVTRLIITVSYPSSSNAPGQMVTVTVVYPYDPLTTYLPWTVRLGSTTEGVITF
jgi:Flp pilus assembly protein TadG